MTKWDKLFGLDHPEAYGEIKDPKKPEDKDRYFFNTDLQHMDHEILLIICQALKIDIQHLYKKYGKTKREQLKKFGLKYKP